MKMVKRPLSLLLAILCVAFCCVVFSSCGLNKNKTGEPYDVHPESVDFDVLQRIEKDIPQFDITFDSNNICNKTIDEIASAMNTKMAAVGYKYIKSDQPSYYGLHHNGTFTGVWLFGQEWDYDSIDEDGITDIVIAADTNTPNIGVVISVQIPLHDGEATALAKAKIALQLAVLSTETEAPLSSQEYFTDMMQFTTIEKGEIAYVITAMTVDDEDGEIMGILCRNNFG